jgi:hypothetical protein
MGTLLRHGWRWRSLVQTRSTTYNFDTGHIDQNQGATWHPYIQLMHATCRPMNHPHQPTRICRMSIIDSPTSSATSARHVESCMPSQHFHVIHTTCHPSSGDMCHFLVGPCQLYKIFQLCFHISCTTYMVSCHVALYELYNQHFFECLAK